MNDSFERAKQLFVDGNLLFGQGQYSSAAQMFRDALQLMPGRPSIQANLGVTMVRLGDWQAATELLKASLDQVPTNRDAWAALGFAQEALGDWFGAIESLGKAQSIDSSGSPPSGSSESAQSGLGALKLAMAHCLARIGKTAQAILEYRRALEHDSSMAQAWSQLGGLLRERAAPGDWSEAARCFRQAISLGADRPLHEFYLAAIQPANSSVLASETTAQHNDIPPSPPAYVSALFNDYAAQFDTHLVAQLGYQAHKTLLAPLLASNKRFAKVVDLGCGTGLCGELIAVKADRLEGVDLAEKMIEQARAKNIYHHLEQADAIEYLKRQSQTIDLLIAADVLIYIGHLEALFTAARYSLMSGASFVFSLEKSRHGTELQLLPSLRYSHSLSYVARLADEFGFALTHFFEADIRLDSDGPIPGIYVYLEAN